MRYSNELCPHCGQAFQENDDIVVCPECGSPHHRGCWAAHGRCANEERHAEGFVWKKTDVPSEPSTSAPEQPQEQNEKKNLDIICPDCGHVSPNGTLRCPECGALLIAFNPMGSGEPPLAQFRPGFDSHETIGELTSGDIALFTRVSGARYIKSFRKQAQGKKFTWNWGAAFFMPYWFFYRKLYKAGTIFLALSVAISLWMMPLANNFYSTYDSVAGEVQHLVEEEGEDAALEAFEKRADELAQVITPLYLPVAAQIALHLAAAIIADKLYWKKAKTQIPEIRQKHSDEREIQLELFRAGGTSILAGAVSYFASEILLMLASYIAG